MPLNKVWFLIYFCLYLFLYSSYRLYTYPFITSLVHSLQFIVHKIFIYFHINIFTHLPIYPSTHSLIYTHHYNNSEYLATGRYGTGVLPLRGRWDTSCGNCFHFSCSIFRWNTTIVTFVTFATIATFVFTGGTGALPLRGKGCIVPLVEDTAGGTGVYLYGGRGMSPLPPCL